MPYRHLHLEDEDTGEVEHFTVRVEDRAIMEWLGNREMLTRAGFPDRPPDVDTALIRLWAQRPGEEDLPYFVMMRQRQADIFDILGVFWRSPFKTCGVSVYGWQDGTITCIAGSIGEAGLEPVVQKHYEPDADPNEAWTDIEALIMKLDVDWPEGEPEVMLPEDYEALEVELALAAAEARVGFGVMEGRA